MILRIAEVVERMWIVKFGSTVIVPVHGLGLVELRRDLRGDPEHADRRRELRDEDMAGQLQVVRFALPLNVDPSGSVIDWFSFFTVSDPPTL